MLKSLNLNEGQSFNLHFIYKFMYANRCEGAFLTYICCRIQGTNVSGSSEEWVHVNGARLGMMLPALPSYTGTSTFSLAKMCCCPSLLIDILPYYFLNCSITFSSFLFSITSSYIWCCWYSYHLEFLLLHLHDSVSVVLFSDSSCFHGDSFSCLLNEGLHWGSILFSSLHKLLQSTQFHIHVFAHPLSHCWAFLVSLTWY